MLSFLYPAFLLGAIAAAVPIVLHLIRREAAPEVRFSAVRLLRRAPTEQTRWQRLREWLLLVARVAAILLLAAAFARPYLAAHAGPGSSVTIVAVDTSLSMGAPGRFDRARTRARTAVEEAPAGSFVGLLSFDDRPELVVEPVAERATVLAAIERLRPGYGATRYGPALARARESIPGSGRIVVVTDLQRAGWDHSERPSLAAGVEVRVADVGDGGDNLAVVGVERSPTGVIAVLRNTGSREREARVRLVVDGRDAAASRVRVTPGATTDVAFDLPARAVRVAITIEDAGGWPGDDTRHLVTGARQGPRLIAVTERAGQGLLYVQRALAAAAEDSRFRVEMVGPTDLDQALESGDPIAAVLVAGGRGFDRTAGERLRQYVRTGGGLVVAAGPSIDPDAAAAIAGLDRPPRARGGEIDVRLAPVDTRHPVFHAFGPAASALGSVRFTRKWDLDEEGWEVIARFTDGRAALVERRVEGGRVLLFASDLDQAWNDLPLHPAFVPFLHETLRHAAQVRPSPRELLVADAPPGAPRAPGIATLAGGRAVAVNVDPRESDPARMDAGAFTASLGPPRAATAADRSAEVREREASQRYWRYGLMLMLAALVCEGLLAGGYRFA
jgi:Aerotolerance regulator N-terminal/von Willebrand factor type A domain